MTMNSEDHINDILNSLDGMQRAKAPQDGFAMVQQKLATQKTTTGSGTSKMVGLRVAAAASLIVCANALALSNFISHESDSREAGGYSQLTTDFNLYDYE